MTAAAAERVRFVDVLRVVGAFQMVQGHTVDAVLSTAVRTGSVHAGWTWLRGLTAVAFLFAAGISFHLSTVRRFEAHRRDARAVAHRLRRAGMLVLLGYALHLPLAAAWGGVGGDAANSLRRFAAVDILQCIGVSLALLEALVCLLPSRRAFVAACACLGAALLFGAPVTRALVPAGMLAPLVDYVTPLGGSVFPLLPWAGHLCLGVVVGACIDVPLARTRAARLGALGVLLLACAALARASGAAPSVVDHLGRIAWVTLATSPLALADAAARTPAWVRRLGGETLFVYVVHVLFVYGDGVGLAAVVGPTLAPPFAALVALAVTAASFALAFVYRDGLRRVRLAPAGTPG